MPLNTFIGRIEMFGGNFAPRAWALCDGQLLAIAQHTALFSILGTTYGGDGRTTFALPDMRGRVPLHEGHGPGLSDRRLGLRGGAEHTTLTVATMPSHNHSVAANIRVTEEDATTTEAAGASFGGVAASNVYDTAAPSANMANGTLSVNFLNNGGQQSYNNMMPYLVVHFIICMQGTYPSRS